jgi:hypothetical protein
VTIIVAGADAGSAPARTTSLRDTLAQIVEWVIPFGLVAIIIIGMALVLSGRA